MRTLLVAMLIVTTGVLMMSDPSTCAAQKPAPKGERIKIEVTGKLKTGLVAIGGETTGTIITAQNHAFELQLKGADQQALAEKLHNKVATASGELTIRQGVEVRKPRWIITVETLRAADDEK